MPNFKRARNAPSTPSASFRRTASRKPTPAIPGLPMGAAAMAYTLWTRHLRHNPRNPDWPDRDRFILSGGHGSMLLYSLLHLTGYDLPLEELQAFPPVGQPHPRPPGIRPDARRRVTTGPLGRASPTASAWPSPSAPGSAVSTGRVTRSSITTPMPSSPTAT